MTVIFLFLLHNISIFGEQGNTDRVIVSLRILMKYSISCISIYTDSRNARQAVERLCSIDNESIQVSILGHCEYWTELGEFFTHKKHILIAADNKIKVESDLIAAGSIIRFIKNTKNPIDVDSGLSFLGRILFNLGVPRANTKEYEQAINMKKLLLFVEGEPTVVENACDILQLNSQHVTIHRA